MGFLNHREGGKVFYQVFLLSPLHCTVTGQYKYVRGCVVLKKYVWISSKNSASVFLRSYYFLTLCKVFNFNV
jgi:hypothetical protein